MNSVFLYVANNAARRLPYLKGQTDIAHHGEKVVDLPAGPINHYWTKSGGEPDGTQLYVGVGSNSDIAEPSTGKRAIKPPDRVHREKDARRSERPHTRP